MLVASDLFLGTYNRSRDSEIISNHLFISLSINIDVKTAVSSFALLIHDLFWRLLPDTEQTKNVINETGTFSNTKLICCCT